jgi:hypothetical protein
MLDNEICSPTNKRTPWNKGKLIGARPPLRPKHVWSIRTRLLLEGRIRDLALFNLAIDSKLRGCDVVAVKVEDVAPNGYTMDRATVRQKKTGRSVKFELADQTRQAIDDEGDGAADDALCQKWRRSYRLPSLWQRALCRLRAFRRIAAAHFSRGQKEVVRKIVVAEFYPACQRPLRFDQPKIFPP